MIVLEVAGVVLALVWIFSAFIPRHHR